MRAGPITLLLVLLCSSWAAGQSDAVPIRGVVTDSAGAVVASASVEILTIQQQVIAASQTNSQGQFSISNIPDGSYVLRVSGAGFDAVFMPLNLSNRRDGEIAIRLSPNALSATVTVTADTGRAEELIRVPQQINIVSADAIAQRATSVLAQAADEEVGVSLQRTSPTIGAVLVRGLTEVGVYVDGIRYTNSTQRGGINTFFNLNEPSSLQSVEVQRSPNTAQFGSDGLGGNVQLLSRQPPYGLAKPKIDGEYRTFYSAADNSFGGNLLASYGARDFGILGNVFGRRVNTLRPGGGIDSHSALTRFLGVPSDIIGSSRLSDTGFTQYGVNVHATFAPSERQSYSMRYLRSQQDGGKRYDQLLGGDGNLVAELRNLMLDFGYLRYVRHGAGFFDTLTANISFNSQREERQNQGGQGNPFAAITNDRERTTSWGGSFFLDKQFSQNGVLVGADYYHDRVSASSFNADPASGTATTVRPRVPNGATYDLAGVYIQDVFEAVRQRLRISGALRFNYAGYRSRYRNAPVIAGQPLFPDDSARFTDFSGRVGASLRIVGELHAAFNYSRGFRAPNITSLGGLGLVGVGFQVSAADVAGLGAAIGTAADEQAVSTGVPVEPLRSEISDNFDLSLRYKNRSLQINAGGFLIDYGDTIVRQTLILPQGAVGRRLGSQTITAQNANGAVFVPASTSPVLIQANFGDTRVKGAELSFEYRLAKSWTAGGNYSYVFAADKVTGAVPNLGGGGLPPQFAFLRLRYQPVGQHSWVEGYANLVGRQSRLSSLDIADRRTGAARSRAQIQNFFRRGACVRGVTVNLSGTGCGATAGNPNYMLVATGETLAQVLERVLPLNRVINGVLVANNNTAVPLYNAIPGYALFNLRGGHKFGERHEVTIDFENIFDKSHRAPGWGIDGPGRSVTLRYKFSF